VFSLFVLLLASVSSSLPLGIYLSVAGSPEDAWFYLDRSLSEEGVDTFEVYIRMAQLANREGWHNRLFFVSKWLIENTPDSLKSEVLPSIFSVIYVLKPQDWLEYIVERGPPENGDSLQKFYYIFALSILNPEDGIVELERDTLLSPLLKLSVLPCFPQEMKDEMRIIVDSIAVNSLEEITPTLWVDVLMKAGLEEVLSEEPMKSYVLSAKLPSRFYPRLYDYFVRMGNLEGAMELLERGIGYYPLDVELRILAGQFWMIFGEKERAIAELEIAVSVDSTPNALISLAQAYSEVGNYEKVFSLVQECIRRVGGSPEAYYLLAVSAWRRGRLADAFYYGGRGEKLAVDKTLFWGLFGRLYRTSGMPDRGYRLFNRAWITRKDPSFYLGMVYCLIDMGMVERAESLLIRGISMFPDEPEFKNALAYLWANQGKLLDSARVLIEDALRSAPDDPAFLDSYGWILLLLGESERALEVLARSAQGLPEEECFYHLALAYEEEGFVELADLYRRKARDARHSEGGEGRSLLLRSP